MEHEMLSTNGQSGSPIYGKDNKIVAIHKGYNDELKMKVATKININMIQQIEEWCRKDFQLVLNYEGKDKVETELLFLQKENEQLKNKLKKAEDTANKLLGGIQFLFQRTSGWRRRSAS